MRLILHIGTHKTGTTAIQRFLAGNRAPLARHGFHYAAHGSTSDANLVANAVALGNTDAARDFFRRQFEAAARADAQAVIVSAENFYSMEVVAAALAGRRPDVGMSQEAVLVRRLHDLLPEAVTETRVVSYFRRPDRFAESLYNQRIKYETFAEPFDRYLQTVNPMFNYHAHASIWADVFGKGSCTFKVYESVVGDARQAFLRDVLGVTDTELFVEEATRDNERVSRDVLEFKRELNATTPDGERALEYRIVRELEQRMNLLADEPKQYQEFMSPAERATFLTELAPELMGLRSVFDLPAFPAVEETANSAWTPYPGLSEERRAQIRREYVRINRRPAVRYERLAIRSTGRLRRHRAGRALLASWRRTRMPRAARRVARRA